MLHDNYPFKPTKLNDALIQRNNSFDYSAIPDSSRQTPCRTDHSDHTVNGDNIETTSENKVIVNMTRKTSKIHSWVYLYKPEPENIPGGCLNTRRNAIASSDDKNVLASLSLPAINDPSLNEQRDPRFSLRRNALTVRKNSTSTIKQKRAIASENNVERDPVKLFDTSDKPSGERPCLRKALTVDETPYDKRRKLLISSSTIPSCERRRNAIVSFNDCKSAQLLKSASTTAICHLRRESCRNRGMLNQSSTVDENPQRLRSYSDEHSYQRRNALLPSSNAENAQRERVPSLPSIKIQSELKVNQTNNNDSNIECSNQVPKNNVKGEQHRTTLTNTRTALSRRSYTVSNEYESSLCKLSRNRTEENSEDIWKSDSQTSRCKYPLVHSNSVIGNNIHERRNLHPISYEVPGDVRRNALLNPNTHDRRRNAILFCKSGNMI